jgi:hypothetical protein
MMAREIKLAKIADYMEGQVEQLLRATVLQTDTLLKQNSPVDTGRFRASWQVGENATGNYDAGSQQEPVNANRSLTNPPAKPEAQIRKMNYSQEKLGNYYSIHNNLPYAEPLAGGSSKQADAGWIDLIGKEMQSYVRSQYEKIKRQG